MDQFAVEVISTVWPTFRVALAGSREIEISVGPALTVMLAVPEIPKAVAVMVAVPAAWAVTTPRESTVATPGALEVQVARES